MLNPIVSDVVQWRLDVPLTLQVIATSEKWPSPLQGTVTKYQSYSYVNNKSISYYISVHQFYTRIIQIRVPESYDECTFPPLALNVNLDQYITAFQDVLAIADALHCETIRAIDFKQCGSQLTDAK